MAKDQQSLQINQEMEQVATSTATEKANVAKWGLNTVVALFAILIVVVILVARETDTNLVGGLAALGLIIIWIIGRKRGKQLFARFYVEELSSLHSKIVEGITAPGPLTNKEIQVLNYVAKGYSNKQIGLELRVSENTVKYFVSNSMTKLEAYDRTHAVVVAIKRGLISI